MRARGPAILNFLWRQRTASEGKLGKTLRYLGNRLSDLSPHRSPSHSVSPTSHSVPGTCCLSSFSRPQSPAHPARFKSSSPPPTSLIPCSRHYSSVVQFWSKRLLSMFLGSKDELVFLILFVQQLPKL